MNGKGVLRSVAIGALGVQPILVTAVGAQPAGGRAMQLYRQTMPILQRLCQAGDTDACDRFNRGHGLDAQIAKTTQLCTKGQQDSCATLEEMEDLLQAFLNRLQGNMVRPSRPSEIPVVEAPSSYGDRLNREMGTLMENVFGPNKLADACKRDGMGSKACQEIEENPFPQCPQKTNQTSVNPCVTITPLATRISVAIWM